MPSGRHCVRGSWMDQSTDQALVTSPIWASRRRRRPPEKRHADASTWWIETYGYHLNSSTVSDILGPKYASLDEHDGSGRGGNADNININNNHAENSKTRDGRKRERRAKWQGLEEELYKWVRGYEAREGSEASGGTLRDRATELWHQMPCYSSMPCPTWSQGWLARFRARYDIHQPGRRSVRGDGEERGPRGRSDSSNSGRTTSCGGLLPCVHGLRTSSHDDGNDSSYAIDYRNTDYDDTSCNYASYGGVTSPDHASGIDNTDTTCFGGHVDWLGDVDWSGVASYGDPVLYPVDMGETLLYAHPAGPSFLTTHSQRTSGAGDGIQSSHAAPDRYSEVKVRVLASVSLQAAL
ncbi:hypothetical protein NLU13_3078 [Sarocladium strictum]|uniref:HTH CENPB-type domain-containing protein n=1 Tax=Sarocladium strictum TaxID=5046 RepID=A0AA39GMS5_SARSR|nr:hypothetical protein NLU13_3078 [Sarocladium strictum]